MLKKVRFIRFLKYGAYLNKLIKHYKNLLQKCKLSFVSTFKKLLPNFPAKFFFKLKKSSKVDFIFFALTPDIFGKIRLICLILLPLYKLLCF